MKDETAGVAIKKFVGLKPKMYSFLVDDRKDMNKKAEGMNKIAVAIISHGEYKDVLLKTKYLRHLMKELQIKIIE